MNCRQHWSSVNIRGISDLSTVPQQGFKLLPYQSHIKKSAKIEEFGKWLFCYFHNKEVIPLRLGRYQLKALLSRSRCFGREGKSCFWNFTILTFGHVYAQYRPAAAAIPESFAVTLDFRVHRRCWIGPTCHARHAILRPLLRLPASPVRSADNSTKERFGRWTIAFPTAVTSITGTHLRTSFEMFWHFLGKNSSQHVVRDIFRVTKGEISRTVPLQALLVSYYVPQAVFQSNNVKIQNSESWGEYHCLSQPHKPERLCMTVT